MPSPARDLPTFLVIGAPKSGSTTLFEHLRSHPEVFVAPEKEVHFFSDHHWAEGLAWYRAKFADVGDAKAVGEVSPSYSADPLFGPVPERIVGVLPDVQLVYIMRHPVERLISHYRQDALDTDEPPEEGLLSPRHLTRSSYAHQLHRYLEHFRRDQILVVTTRELEADPAALLSKVYAHIGVDASFVPPWLTRRSHEGATFRSDSGLMSRVRATPLHRVGKLLPQPVRHKLWLRVGSKQINPQLAHLKVTDKLYAQIVEALRSDLEELQRLLPGFDCWGLLD